MSLDPDVAWWAEMAEARAAGELVAAVAQLPDDPVGALVATPGGGVAFAYKSVSMPFFNRVIGVGVARPAVEADVDDVVAFYDGAATRVSVAQLAPHASPSEVIGWFEARGYARSQTWVKMWHRLVELPEIKTDLRIERVGPEWAAEFAQIGIVEAYDFPQEVGVTASAIVGHAGWTHYLGFDGDTPVSSGAMRIEDGVAWFGFGATTPTHRGRGGQSAMFAHRLRDARDAGCRFAIVETGEDTPENQNPSYRNMVRAGFELAYLRPNWVRQV
jgi:hypothetical protein